MKEINLCLILYNTFILTSSLTRIHKQHKHMGVHACTLAETWGRGCGLTFLDMSASESFYLSGRGLIWLRINSLLSTLLNRTTAQKTKILKEAVLTPASYPVDYSSLVNVLQKERDRTDHTQSQLMMKMIISVTWPFAWQHLALLATLIKYLRTQYLAPIKQHNCLTLHYIM